MITMKWNRAGVVVDQRWSCMGSLAFPDSRGILAELESITVVGKNDTVYIARDLGIRTQTAAVRDDMSATWIGSCAKSLYRLIESNEWAIREKLKIRRS